MLIYKIGKRLRQFAVAHKPHYVPINLPILFAAVIFVTAYAAKQYVPKNEVAAITASSFVAAAATIVLTAAAIAKQQ